MRSPNQPRKLPKQERSRATVEAIVQATARILEREGREGLSTNRVARVAGISVGSLYQYFPNKEALVAEVRERFSAGLRARLLGMLGRLAGLGVADAIRDYVRTLVAIHAESPGVHHAVGTGPPPEAQQALLDAAVGFLEARRDELRRPDLRLSARVLTETAELVIHHTALRDPARLEDPAWVDELCEMLVRYLVRDEAAGPRPTS